MKETVCRLCLQTINANTSDNCQAVEESLLKSLKLNLKISKENVMCIECANSLRVLCIFTAGSGHKRDVTLPLPDLENVVKWDSEPVETTSNPKSLMETKVKCRFCATTREREDLITLQVPKENKFLLEQYILKTILKNTDEFLACVPCLEALEGGFSVILKCLEVEEKISKYVELKGTDDEGQVELGEVQQFMFGPIIKLETESFGVNKFEEICDHIQEEYTTMTKTEIKYEKELNNTELIIKTEENVIKSKESDCDGFQDHINENKVPTEHLYTSMVISEMRKLIDYIKRHLLIHKNPSKIEIFKCDLCSFETKVEHNLKRHLLTHKSPSEIIMFQCELCSYETKYNSKLKQHLLTHKNPETKMFKCGMCSFEAKYKYSLRRHLLIHKSPSELPVFKCELCSYETKHNSSLRQHFLTHKNPETKMFKCGMCSYEGKFKYSIKRHLLIHKSLSEIPMFKCKLCSYETKHKSGLLQHSLNHKSPSEMFKCEACSYKANNKSILEYHLLTHKSQSEIEIFKCKLCSYETKYRSSLNRHLLNHKSSCDVVFKCEMCLYKTKSKLCLERHLLIHRSPS